MDYKSVYTKIIENAKLRDFVLGNSVFEKHHILPKSCGGSNKKENLVSLTLKEHFLCHVLLERIYRNTEHHKKMLRAVVMMTRGGKVNSRIYKRLKEDHIKNLRLQTISEEQKLAISIANKGNSSRTGIPHSEETKRKISKANKGKTHTDETKQLFSEQRKGRIPWNKGTTGSKNTNYPKNRKSKGPLSSETIEKMRESRRKWHQSKGHIING
jgi:hypothetical protein